jgi:hypothetical protein
VGGCWALRITLTDRQLHDFSYFGIVDTGSPFLTSPSLAMERTTSMAKKFPTTLEQYGESTGGMEWRQTRYASILVEERENIILGIASPDVIHETGGVFVGLMNQDDHRPTFLQQFGYQSFAMEFRRPPQQPGGGSSSSSIVFSSGSMISETDSESFELFDLTPYGPDLHHYGILLGDNDQLEFVFGSDDDDKKKTRRRQIPTSSLKRPVVAILDTGLTGCIFSDSLFEDLVDLGIFISQSSSDGGTSSSDVLQGITVTLPTTTTTTTRSGSSKIELSSCDDYWRFSSFRLPWFDNEERHPHIIALGCTFWANVDSLVIDTITRRAKILLPGD